MPFGSLWIPVVVSTVAVFVGSSILHMLFTYHRADHKPLPSEDAVREALGKAAPPPGLYFTPHCSSHAQLREPAVVEKFAKGPVAMITVMKNGPPELAKNLAQWLLFVFLVSFTAAYVARHTLHPGDAGLLVMRITGTVAFAGYGLSHVSDSIWKAEPWSNTVRALIDGGIYALITGLTFRLLWPAA